MLAAEKVDTKQAVDGLAFCGSTAMLWADPPGMERYPKRHLQRRTAAGLVGAVLFWCLFLTTFGQADSLASAAQVRGLNQCDVHVAQWWRDGFRSSPVLCWRGMHYGVVMDARTLQILGMGAMAPAGGYAEIPIQMNAQLARLPAAALDLEARIGNEIFTCKQGGEVRLVEGGRYLQRMDITGLVFVNAAGKRLDADARLEIIAWPDSFTLVLELKPRGDLAAAAVALRLGAASGHQARSSELGPLAAGSLRRVVLHVYPSQGDPEPVGPTLEAVAGSTRLDVAYDPVRQWHQVRLPSHPATNPGAQHLESVKVHLRNPTASPRTIKINFAKEKHVPGITGLVAMLRDKDHFPTGIPLQLSKNWHVAPDNQECLYQGAWLHVLAMLTLPPGADIEMEFCLVQNCWGTLPLASHAQLCVIGCGLVQLWDQAAIGSWGESICYNIDRCAGRSVIADIRPLMVNSYTPRNGDPKWNWTNNVGGGDFLIYHDKNGVKQRMTEVRARYASQGPNLTDVCYTGITADGAITSSVRVQTPRCQDINRAYHHLRYDVKKPVAFGRLAFYQLGGDTYNDHEFKMLAMGNDTGVTEEWPARTGGLVYHRRGAVPAGGMPWFSLHQESGQPGKPGPWANRGLILRSWQARLGGKPVGAHFASFGTHDRFASANIELAPPPDLRDLQPGDYIEATVELVVPPQFARDYYGPDKLLREDLILNENTWKPVFRQAAGGAVNLIMHTGTSLGNYPLRVRVGAGNQLEFTTRGGITHTPLVITGLSSHRGFDLQESVQGNWQGLKQAVSVRDYWQTQYDPADGSYTLTFNIELGGERRFRLIPSEG